MSKKPNLESLLYQFRALARNEDAMPIIGDDAALQVISAWQNIKQVWAAIDNKPPLFTGNGFNLWEWICQGWSIDAEDVSDASGLSIDLVRAKLRILQGNRLIYPDGGLAKGAEIAVRAGMAKRLGLKPGRKSDPKKEKDDAN